MVFALFGAALACLLGLLAIVALHLELLLGIVLWIATAFFTYWGFWHLDKQYYLRTEYRKHRAQKVKWALICISVIAFSVLAYRLSYTLVGDERASKNIPKMIIAELTRVFQPSSPTIPQPPPEIALEVKTALEKKINLFEFYASYEWRLTGHNRLEPMPVADSVLKAAFQRDLAYRLTPLIRNDNEIPLFEPRITIILPLNVTVNQTRLWSKNFTDTSQTLHAEGFGPVVKGQYRGLNESLFLKFPHPGRYPASYTIHGIVRDIAISVQGEFFLDIL